MHAVLNLIVDKGSMFSIKPGYAQSMITTLARIGGHPVGILANQPMVRAGAIDSNAAEKATHFIQLCDAFHLPLIFFADVPGYMTGKRAEREAILRRGLRIAHVLGQCSVPMVSVVVRKTFGMEPPCETRRQPKSRDAYQRASHQKAPSPSSRDSPGRHESERSGTCHLQRPISDGVETPDPSR
ncbi:carboxyl transferase domain-containing protein [Thermodesulfobacteriota bacterium]